MEEIPQPPPLPLLGNLRDIDPASPVQSFEHIATKYGPIFKLQLQGKYIIFVAGHEIFSEICDENRFQKVITDPLEQVRNGVGSGLFTAYPGEHDWEIAHRTLMPAFGPLPIQDMFGEMHDVCSQLVLKWSRLRSDEKINVTDDYTRLTLDSIALCAMDTRFNSFYHDDMHPFVQAMVDFLAESGLRANRPPVAQIFLRDANRKYKTNIETMKEVARKVIVHRRKNPSSKRDLLNAMINGRDPKTDEAMSDESIMNNMVTFLIAGHETTSGLLSFTTYYLLKNPRTFRQAQEEVDRVVGQGPVEAKHISQLHYVQACLRESIRLQPTAPAIGRSVRGTHPEPISGGRYLIPPGIDVVCLLGAIQRDPAVFGEEAGSFQPERMLEDEFRNLPSSSWKPFGTGPRACIGRPFAWQEAILALAMILRHFDLRLVNPSYELRIKQTLTTKPDGLEIYATLRDKHESGQIEKKLFGGGTTNRQRDYDIVQEIPLSSTRPITILYGSNTGTCEGIAQTLANRSVARGFMPNIALLDSAVGKLPTDQPVIVITASFEGEPADNASQFFEWIMGTSRGALDGVQYAVFGCGHHDWVTTYQRIPQLIDMKLERSGATRLVDRGESDVALGNVLDDFDSWADSKLWPVIGSSESKPGDDFSALNIEISSSARIATLKHNVHEVLVERTAVLSAPEVGEKRMVTFRLPSGTTYSTGDYLSVLPINSPQTISRVLSRFGLAWDTDVLIKPPSHTALPLNQLQPVTLLLGCYVELSSQASKKNILTLARLAEDNSIKQALEDLAADASMTKLSVLDILEMYPELPCPFAVFLSLLPSMRVRQYSIASSPLVDPHLVSITYGVIDAPIRQLPGSKHFLGAATNYMKALQPGEKAQVSVKKSHYSFHLPGDNSRPVIMICAGTGIAPFRGFVQERAVKIEAGQKLGPAVLFVGCKYKDSDRLHADEFDKWEKMGAVEMYYAFSREPEASIGCRYAQERMALEKERIFELFARGGKVFVCGSSRLGAGVKQVTKSIFLEKSRENGEERTEQEMEDWFNGLKVQERWCSDVFD